MAILMARQAGTPRQVQNRLPNGGRGTVTGPPKDGPKGRIDRKRPSPDQFRKGERRGAPRGKRPSGVAEERLRQNFNFSPSQKTTPQGRRVTKNPAPRPTTDLTTHPGHTYLEFFYYESGLPSYDGPPLTFTGQNFIMTATFYSPGVWLMYLKIINAVEKAAAKRRNERNKRQAEEDYLTKVRETARLTLETLIKLMFRAADERKRDILRDEIQGNGQSPIVVKFYSLPPLTLLPRTPDQPGRFTEGPRPGTRFTVLGGGNQTNSTAA